MVNGIAPFGAIFDRMASLLAGLTVVGLVIFLLVRNTPIASPQLFFALRVILSFGIATLGATIPGFLNVSWKGGGLIVRSGGALALFVLTFIFTPNSLAASNVTNTINGPGVIAGNNSHVTINPDPNSRSCRDPSHGVERYERSFSVIKTSGEMGGGHTRDEWCNNVLATLAGDFPGGHFTVTNTGESKKNHCPPANCPQYTYVCTVQVEADPVYKSAVGPECR